MVNEYRKFFFSIFVKNHVGVCVQWLSNTNIMTQLKQYLTIVWLLTNGALICKLRGENFKKL